MGTLKNKGLLKAMAGEYGICDANGNAAAFQVEALGRRDVRHILVIEYYPRNSSPKPQPLRMAIASEALSPSHR